MFYPEPKQYRKMLNIQRLSGSPKLRSYNLAEHSYFLGILFSHFCDYIGVDYDVKSLQLVFSHDLLETETMDLPYHIKHLNSGTEECWDRIEYEVALAKGMLPYTDASIEKNLTEEQYIVFKVADTVELLHFMTEEIKLGNTTSTTYKVISKWERSVLHLKSFLIKK